MPAPVKSQEFKDKKTLLETCSAGSQAEMRDCVAAAVRKSEMRVAASEKKAAQKISGWDEADVYTAKARDELKKAQEAFIAFRQSQCAFDESLIGGGAGNSHEIRRLSCVYELNSRQADFIDASTKGLFQK